MVRSRYLATLVVGLVLGTVAPSAAQTVVVRVVRAEAEAPLAGALITLRTADGALVLRGLADERGRLALRAPNGGTFVVRADAIGYRGSSSAPVTIDAAQTREMIF